MIGCCFQDVESVASQSLPDPQIVNQGDAIVKVELAGLCGSDLHPFFGREKGLDPGTVMGHEFVGQVVECGESVSRFQVGDRVCSPFTTNCGDCYYCRIGLTARCEQSQLFGWRAAGGGLHGGQAEYVLIPDANATLLNVPATLSNEQALLLGDNLSTGYFAAEMAEVNEEGVYLVIGCGTVGLLAIEAAKQLGAKTIIAHDLVDSRLSLAEELGAITFADPDAAMKELKLRTNSRGADGVMELVGLIPAQQFAYDAIRPGGVISTIGCHCTEHFGFSPVNAYDKNLSYRSGRCSARKYMDLLVDEIGNWELPTSQLISHRFGIDESERAYDVFANRKESCVKAVFEF